MTGVARPNRLVYLASFHLLITIAASATTQAPSVPVRLVNGNSQYEGRVEIKYQGSWGTICDEGWTDADAMVICRMLGHPYAARAWSDAHFGQGSGPILLDQVSCQGYESSIDECDHNGWYNQACSHSQDAGVTCSMSTSPVPVRLVGGSNYFEGTVEVYYQGQWGTICDDAWDTVDAGVICRQLDYDYAVEAWTDAHFGEGSGPVLLDKVECDGPESMIEQCQHSDWSQNDCSHGRDAGVTCRQPLVPPSVELRLVGGSTKNEGRVEVYYQDQWGTICSNGFEIEEADVVCRQLGFPSAQSFFYGANFFGQGSGLITLTQLACEGYESNINKCLHDGWLNTGTCNHDMDVAVRCDQKSDFQTPPPPLGLSVGSLIGIAVVSIVTVIAIITIIVISLVVTLRKKPSPASDDIVRVPLASDPARNETSLTQSASGLPSSGPSQQYPPGLHPVSPSSQSQFPPPGTALTPSPGLAYVSVSPSTQYYLVPDPQEQVGNLSAPVNATTPPEGLQPVSNPDVAYMSSQPVAKPSPVDDGGN